MSHTERGGYAAFAKTVPGAIEALARLSKAAIDGGLEPGLIELVKLRASQMNGCAFCLAYHLQLARRLGVPQAKFDLLAAWRDAGVFSARERAALLWTETLTDIAHRPVTEAIFAEAEAAFPDGALAHLTASITSINAWNRIAIAFAFPPEIAA